MRIGIDLGGTKIEVIALDENGATLLRHRVPTPTGDYVGTLNAIADLVLLAERNFFKRPHWASRYPEQSQLGLASSKIQTAPC
jgi:predicted NBD/HSP70 family sugar kinase